MSQFEVLRPEGKKRTRLSANRPKAVMVLGLSLRLGLAETVEQVGANRFVATIVPVGWA